MTDQHMTRSVRPTKTEIAAAEGKELPDIITPGLRLLFCGINPGLYSAAVGHHFAGPSNRFWKVLHAAGYTECLLSPDQDHELLARGYGLTNLVERATAGARGLLPAEYVAGRQRLEAKVMRYRPRCVAILGIGAYRTAFADRGAALGEREVGFAGAQLWVLPSPSGLNAHYQLADLTRLFAELHRALAAGG